jgi:hypothetical protein
MTLAVGQKWTFRTPPGFEHSRITIGAIVTLPNGQRIVCCSVSSAPRQTADNEILDCMISFIPMAEPAFTASIVEQDGTGELPPEFTNELAHWRDDPRGLTIFTVPFEGCLDEMIAQQAAALIAQSAA